MTCSKRCANPVRPGTSFFEPTWYQTSTVTVGVDRSGARMTFRPLGSVIRSNGMLMSLPEAAGAVRGWAHADETAVAITAIRMAGRMMLEWRIAGCGVEGSRPGGGDWNADS